MSAPLSKELREKHNVRLDISSSQLLRPDYATCAMNEPLTSPSSPGPLNAYPQG